MSPPSLIRRLRFTIFASRRGRRVHKLWHESWRWVSPTNLYTGRILKAEEVSDLPVQQATKVEMILNLKTAKALGLNIPNTLIGRTDQVIE